MPCLRASSRSSTRGMLVLTCTQLPQAGLPRQRQVGRIAVGAGMFAAAVGVEAVVAARVRQRRLAGDLLVLMPTRSPTGADAGNSDPDRALAMRLPVGAVRAVTISVSRPQRLTSAAVADAVGGQPLLEALPVGRMRIERHCCELLVMMASR